MKEIGLLNSDIADVISRLGHMDEVIVCDAGFPIPAGRAHRGRGAWPSTSPPWPKCWPFCCPTSRSSASCWPKKPEQHSPSMYARLTAMFGAGRRRRNHAAHGLQAAQQDGQGDHPHRRLHRLQQHPARFRRRPSLAGGKTLDGPALRWRHTDPTHQAQPPPRPAARPDLVLAPGTLGPRAPALRRLHTGSSCDAVRAGTRMLCTATWATMQRPPPAARPVPAPPTRHCRSARPVHRRRAPAAPGLRCECRRTQSTRPAVAARRLAAAPRASAGKTSGPYNAPVTGRATPSTMRMRSPSRRLPNHQPHGPASQAAGAKAAACANGSLTHTGSSQSRSTVRTSVASRAPSISSGGSSSMPCTPTHLRQLVCDLRQRRRVALHHLHDHRAAQASPTACRTAGWRC